MKAGGWQLRTVESAAHRCCSAAVLERQVNCPVAVKTKVVTAMSTETCSFMAYHMDDRGMLRLVGRAD